MFLGPIQFSRKEDVSENILPYVFQVAYIQGK